MLPTQFLSGMALLKGNEYLVGMMFSLGNVMGDARKGAEDRGCAGGLGSWSLWEEDSIRADRKKGVRIRTVCLSCQGH